MKRVGGFTLLELLIGLTLLGFILALLFAGFRLTANGWDTIEAKAERDSDNVAVNGLVRRLVSYSVPMQWAGAQEKLLTFVGGASGFKTTAPLRHLGLRAISVAVLPGTAQGTAQSTSQGTTASMRLALRHGPVAYGSPDFSAALADADDRLLREDLVEASFSYFGTLDAGETPGWTEQWPMSKSLPLLVRFRAKTRDGTPISLDMEPMASGGSTIGIRLTAGPVM